MYNTFKRRKRQTNPNQQASLRSGTWINRTNSAKAKSSVRSKQNSKHRITGSVMSVMQGNWKRILCKLWVTKNLFCKDCVCTVYVCVNEIEISAQPLFSVSDGKVCAFWGV